MCVSVRRDAVDLAEPVGDDVGERLVLADPHHRDQVGAAGDRVDLADALERGDRLGDLGDAVGLDVHEHDRGDHGAPPGAVRRVARA